MAQLVIQDFYGLLGRAPRRRDLLQDGIRLVYDGSTLALSTADTPDTVIATAATCGYTTAAWEVTAYSASLDTVRAWMRTLDGGDLIDVTPVWARAPAMIAFATGGQNRRVPSHRVPHGSR
ncbi:hypothetical protein AB0M86_36015 [Streptomyces sp. NPDC051639]|uniref:hypothetical protein n=1 Tax=Streptomyces sp. NPDC051639 TaxID=3155671 RepID=UPI00342554E1